MLKAIESSKPASLSATRVPPLPLDLGDNQLLFCLIEILDLATL